MQENSFISNFKLIIRLVLFIVCLLPILIGIGKLYEKAAGHNVVNYFTKARYDDFYALAPNSLDMVFIGSSHSYCTFDPENFDEKLGILSHQMGTPLQHPDTSLFVLKEILNTQKPKVVVLELYWDVLDDTFEMKQANSFFEVLQNDSLKKQYINSVFPLGEKVKYKILPIRYQQDFFAYEGNELQKKMEQKFGVEKKLSTETISGIEEYRSKGYVYCDITLPKSEYDETNQFKGFDGSEWKIDKTQKKYLDEFVSLCNQNQIELVLVTAPVANVSMEKMENYSFVHNAVEEFSKENNLAYIDYNIVNGEEKLLQNEDFRDDAHLNDKGVKIVNKHFVQWLKNNVEFFKGR